MDYLLHHLFLTSQERLPDKEAVVDSKIHLTYSEVSGRAGFLMDIFQQAGVRRGERVAFFLDHNVEQAIAILAISAQGAVFVPVNALLFPEQVLHILRDSGARVLLTTKSRFEKLEEILNQCSHLKDVLMIEDINGSRMLERTNPVIENDLAAILYTSGSSGRPKGVMLSHKNLLAGCWIVSDYLNLNEDDRILGVLPLSFDYGLNQLITMLAQGGTYYFLTFTFPNDIVKALTKNKITGFAGIPPIWAILVHSSLERTSLPYLRYITNSGGAIPITILEWLKRAFSDADIFLMYGLTEAFRSTYLPPDELERRPTSIGKAIPDTEILVVTKDGKLCGPNEVGELVHRGPTVSPGYWNRTKETNERYRAYPGIDKNENNHERVVFSGDLVKYDEEGFLYFVGRRDAMIKCSGNRISPTEIEEEVYKTGLVKEAAAIGVPDEVAGQFIKVYIVPFNKKNDISNDIATKIIDFCAKHMPNYMVPRYLEVIDVMPKTASGKVDYPALRSRNI